jgi:hypothetical protein
MGDPDLIIIDEPTGGLAPKIVELVAHYLTGKAVSVLLIEETDHRHGHFGSLPCHGTRKYRVEAPRRPAEETDIRKGMAGGLGYCPNCTTG